MREALKMRFYCDFCKKSSGQRAAMVRHESGCTLNPNRKCGMCEFGNAEDEDGRWIGPAADAYYSLCAFDWKRSVAEFWEAHPRERDW